jgi:hypothetical protein
MAAESLKSNTIPLGEAIERLVHVKYSILRTPKLSVNPRLEAELSALKQALNEFSVNVDFECDISADPDIVSKAVQSPNPTALELIASSASSSCCRITRLSKRASRGGSSRASKAKKK